MNKVFLMGRLTKDPEIKTSGDGSLARYTLAVDRKSKKNADKEADFISCVAFGKTAEFVKNYLFKGTKILIVGHIYTGSYKNKDGQTVYSTNVVVDEHYFCESKKDGGAQPEQPSIMEGFMESEAPVMDDDCGLSFLN